MTSSLQSSPDFGSLGASGNVNVNSGRFSLILLEPGEICFEDYLVYYTPLECPFDKPRHEHQKRFSNEQKGSLKICSKSVVFDPFNLSQPLVKFPYKSFEKIVRYDSDDENDDDYNNKNRNNDKNSQSFQHALIPRKAGATSIYDEPSDNKSLAQVELEQIKRKCFAISTKQVIYCKANNKIGPYKSVKRENNSDMHYFQFIFTSVSDSLYMLEKLHSASTLDFEGEEIMIQMALESYLNRNLTFDHNKMDDMFKEQIVFESLVNKINPLVTNPGKVFLTNMCLYFMAFNCVESEQELIKIKHAQIKYIIKRRYHLKGVGCEIVFDKSLKTSMPVETSGSSATEPLTSSRLPYLYLTFKDEETRDLFYTKLFDDQQANLINLNEFSQENMLQKWRYGAISNFDYLMYLNNIADRSYNDLTQYPVFPWCITDYTSDKLDLDDPATFRDLSKPIGALNEERLQRLRQRCAEMQAATTGFSNGNSTADNPIFLYGSHYSTPAFVLFYLVRQYPEWQLCLQNGRFDHPNRLFHSIADTWKNCLNIDSDVKELIPEFYDMNCTDPNQLGSFLRNTLELDLGVRSDGVRVNHVVLPKWANNSPHDFIVRMRDALESSIVSEGLHKWIDLIFGYKQRGDEALKADNLFYYLCYEGAVDLKSISSYSERKSLEIQIQEFGQIPTQLFQTPHLPRAHTDLLYEAKCLSLNSDTENASSYDVDATNKTSLGIGGYNDNINNSSKKDGEDNLNDTADEKEASWRYTSRRKSSMSSQKSSTNNQFSIVAANLTQLKVRLEVKMHKSQVNDCLFVNTHTSTRSHLETMSPAAESRVPSLPLVCTVSNDNWIKIYSLEDQSIYRSHNVCDLSLSSVDCVQIASSQNALNLDPAVNSSTDDYELIEMDQLLNLQSPRQQSPQLYDAKYNRTPSSSSSSSKNKFIRTLLFLSCWDNSVYIYDMNYNRCIYTLNYAHEDAVTRIRTRLVKSATGMSKKLSKQYANSFYAITSSWDSLIKLWRIPTSSNIKYKFRKRQLSLIESEMSVPKNSLSRSHSRSSASLLNTDAIKLQFSNELCHDSAIRDFELSKTYLTSLCDDGNLYIWKLAKAVQQNGESTGSDSVDDVMLVDENDYALNDQDDDDDDEDEKTKSGKISSTITDSYEQIESTDADENDSKQEEYTYNFLYSIEACEADIGKINDCKLIETSLRQTGFSLQMQRAEAMNTLAICTSFGFVKIFNLKTRGELFTLKLTVPNSQQPATLNKLYYTNDLIITIDAAGYIYFIDLKQQQQQLATSFLSHTIKLGSHALTCLSIYNDLIICVGDSAGNVYFLSLFDF